ncbi:terpene cyclase/mutase family protein [Streptomyces phaeochromogenes]|nr:terpene cyclase/mutase family protein [Streptomyces phaeochromogenes]
MLLSSLHLSARPEAALAPRSAYTPELARLHDEGLKRLRAHVIGQVGNDGAIRDRCASRVLESALMLHLLRAEDAFPGTQRGVTTYLETRRKELSSLQKGFGGAAVALERELADAVLSGGTPDEDAGVEVFDTFEHFTSERKRFMFHTLLTELGVVDSKVRFDLAAVRYDLYATWVNLEMCALKILRAEQQGEPGAATAEDRGWLMDQLATGSDRSIFEADVFAHAVALLAARKVSPGDPLVAEGIEALLRSQNPDGGFPFIAGWEPFGTAVAGLGLLTAGTTSEVTLPMAEFLVKHQNPDGGWGFAPGVRQSDADCSPYCLEMLRGADPVRFAPEIAKGERYLLDLVNPDGGFGTYRRGDTSEVGVTGSSVSALAPHRDACAPVLDEAVRYLLSCQRPDGTFERSWSLSEANAMFRVLFALRHYASGAPEELRAPVAEAASEARRYLTSTQNVDGGWGQRKGDDSDVLSTACSLLALVCCEDVPPTVLRDGVAWLLSRQQSDGGFSSVPDSAGPRPLPHDLPVLADGYALLALGHVLSA